MIKLGARELRKGIGDRVQGEVLRNKIYIVLDSVLDTYNVGAIFRLADAVAAEKVILCGETETPPNSRIKKASINTTEWVAWSYAPTAVGALHELRTHNPELTVIVVEQTSRSILYSRAEYMFPLALIVGNETVGVSKEVLAMADKIVEIPMWGVNKSLNVMVSLGIVLYEVMKKT